MQKKMIFFFIFNLICFPQNGLIHAQELTDQVIKDILQQNNRDRLEKRDLLYEEDTNDKELYDLLREEQKVVLPEEDRTKEEIIEEILKKGRIEPKLIPSEKEPFGYSIFNYPLNTFEPYDYGSVDPDYPIGPYDEIHIFLWGEVELSHRLKVNREGKIFIPEVGMVILNGLTLERAQENIKLRMSRVYSGIRNQKVYMDVFLGELRKIKVFVLGEAKRPGGYLVSSVSNGFNGLYHAGGPTTRGSLRHIQIIRKGQIATILDIYDYLLYGNNRNDIRLQNGDIISIPYIRKRVTIEGAVLCPATYELKSDEGLRELIKTAGGLEPDGYSESIHIQRKIENSVSRMIDLNLKDIINADSNFVLQNGDVITVPQISRPSLNYIHVVGEILIPGKYELKSGMTVNDAIQSAGGLLKTSHQHAVEVSRIVAEAEHDSTVLYQVERQNGSFERFLLKPFDIVYVRKNPDFIPQKKVKIVGEVYFPGEYALMHDHELLSNLIDRAGGTKTSAFLSGIHFIRENVGRIDINLTKENPQDDIELQDRDSLYIPQKPATIRIYGEVFFPTNLMYEPGKKISHYIKRAGGFTDKADKGKIVLTLANGRVIEQKRFFMFKKKICVQPGSSIFVPTKPEKEVDWGDVVKTSTTIVSNLVMVIFLIVNINDSK